MDMEMQSAEGLSTYDFEDHQERNKRHGSIYSVSPIIGIIFVCLLFGLYGLVYLIDGILPKPLTLADEKDYPNAFIAERAQYDLKLLTDIGPRITGSAENEYEAVEFFKQKIALIQKETYTNQKVEMDIQTVSGSYFIDYKPHGAINAYGNVQNIIVKLHAKNYSEHSLLVNAHFDSAPTSPGGSDDGINCVTMLEVLRKLSRSPEQLEHNIIFLFNGAEETPLQASHGFITKHKWAKEVQVVVNLEAAGAGGKEILFQAGPAQPWLIKYYQRVPHPNGQAAGEELFQSDLIPSDTDFRVFRDFGKTVGMDFAFTRNGYRYHTKFDGFSNIPLGSYQHVGDNALSLIRNLANAPELSDPHGEAKENFVFYDYMGLFMIYYSETVTIVVNVIGSILSTIVALKSFYDFGLRCNRRSFGYIGFTIGAILLGWIAAGLLVIIIGLIIDAAKFSMSWYSNPWIILGLYVVPMFTCFCGFFVILNHFYSKDRLSINSQTQIQTHILRLIWTVPLLIGTIIGFRSVYVILIPLLFQTFTAAVIQIFCLQSSIRKWQIIYVVGTIIPCIFLMKEVREVIAFVIPICGRMGSERNPEIYIALPTLLFTILITSYYIPLITLVRKPYVVLGSLCGVFLIFFIIVFTPLGFPYSGNEDSPTPQRFWIYHTSRVFHNDTNGIYKEDSGFFMLNIDRNSPNSVEKYVKDLSKAKSITDDCASSLYCGFPVASNRMLPILPASTWIPAEKPDLPEPINLQLNSKAVIRNSVTRFNFTAAGPSQLNIYVSPRENVKLTGTSLVPDVPVKPDIWNNRPVYVVLYTWGKTNTTLTFSLDFETPVNWTKAMFDIALTGTYKHEKINVKTPHFLEFISEFPNWADLVTTLGAYESWVY